MNKQKILDLESIEDLDLLIPGDIIRGMLTNYDQSKVSRQSSYVYFEGHKTRELLIREDFSDDISSYEIDKKLITGIKNGSFTHSVFFKNESLSPRHYLYGPRQKMLEEKDLWRNK